MPTRIRAVASLRTPAACAVIVLGLLSCTAEHESATRPEKERAPQADAAEVAELISFYRLIARAEDYDGKRVSTFGYLDVSQQYNSAFLYPTTEAMDNAMIVDKLVLELSDELWLRVRELDARYVSVMGVFRVETEPTGEYIEFGTLDPVMRLMDMQRD